ncbi:MAG: sulfotransferase family protein [Candidatus Heimdallarchaeaceae archaeon]
MKNRFNISLRYLPRIFLISVIVSLFIPLRIYEHLRFRNKVRNTEIKKDPVFIIGHWRTGTTYLQNLLLNDDQFGYLNLVEATFPYLILGNYKLIRFLMKPLIPQTRPMDAMKMGPDTPQEHEFALTNLCLHSPLTSLFFLNKEKNYLRHASFQNATETELSEWKQAFTYLLRKLTFKEKGKQLLLKNPLDAFRISLLLDMFPNSKFIHIYRNPYDVFYSMIKLYQTNTRLFWFHKPEFNLDNFIFRIYSTMYQELYKELHRIPSTNIIEVKYEELIDNPSRQLNKIYDKISLGDYNLVKENMEKYILSLKEYEVDSYDISSEDEQIIYSKWQEFIDKWNYVKATK